MQTTISGRHMDVAMARIERHFEQFAGSNMVLHTAATRGATLPAAADAYTAIDAMANKLDNQMWAQRGKHAAQHRNDGAWKSQFGDPFL